jgi:DNA-binding XRE family transcriptional regulator
MTKDRFRQLLRRAGLRQKHAAGDLGIAESTIVRWPEERVPAYAAAYALLMDRLSPEERLTARAEIKP